MTAALDTLFYPFEKGMIPAPIPPAKTVFINAQAHDFIRNFDKSALALQQSFKPYEQALKTAGYDVLPALDITDDAYDMALALVPKNITEARYTIAKAIKALKKDGLLICAAANDAGGSRLQKIMTDFGFSNINAESKNKARVVWCHKVSYNSTTLEKEIQNGSYQKILGGEYVSQPGIFGWNKIDKGSEILTQYIPKDLKGTGADFGCGYGYLSRAALETCKNVQKLYAIDADYRAVACTALNTSSSCDLIAGSHDRETDPSVKPKDDKSVETLWVDLTKPEGIPQNLDFIIMNPPFHEGKKTDSDIGAAFIATAHSCLKPGGTLHMVANAGLPYEAVLGQNFSKVEKCHEGQGFKIFKAKK